MKILPEPRLIWPFAETCHEDVCDIDIEIFFRSANFCLANEDSLVKRQ